MTKKMGAPLEFSPADNIVAETRRKLNISQAELAAMLKLTHGAISQFESGKRKISGPVGLLCKILLKHPAILSKLG
ncbi:MAG: helix-turn-helix domain-containing protein [Desulfovibrionaceae bacterium]|nr:helix-turn-helix domain-containing protein [Desulfovibrionaceae bacterium]